MKKDSKASKISSGFNDGFDIDKLASVANQISVVPANIPAPKVEESIESQKKDRRFTIILPHELYMKMVLKTKSEGISFTKYIHHLMESDLS